MSIKNILYNYLKLYQKYIVNNVKCIIFLAINQILVNLIQYKKGLRVKISLGMIELYNL